MTIRTQSIAFLTLLVLAACGGDDRPPPGVDGGPLTYDGGPRPDAPIPPPPDGEVPEVDGGMPGTDGGGGGLCDGVDCTSFDDACNTGECDPSDGTCSAVPVADGTSCDDTVPCTMGDVCTAGACAGATVDCSGMSDACNVGMCDTTSGACVRMPMADGTSCDDASACSSGDVCTTGVCGGTAVDCSGMTDMCNVGTCDATSGSCGQTPMADGTTCNDGNACSTADVCTGGTCAGAASAIPGDTCATRLTIPAGDGIHNLTGMITTCNDNTSTATGCGGVGAGRDVVYRLVLPAARRVRFETTVPASGDYDTVLYLRTACGDTTTEVACNDDGAPMFKSRIVTYLEAGTYYLYVDAWSASATGTYNLTVDISTPDTCASAAPIATPARGATVRVTGDTTGAANNFTPACSTSTAPDHVYELVVTTRGRYRIETMDFAGAYDTILQLRGSPCAGGANLECNDDGGVNFRSRIDRILTPGTYYIVVDGFTSGAGSYILEVEHQQGDAILLGHDFYNRETSADRALANAIFSSNNRSPELALRIVDYRQFAGTIGAEEITNTQAVISERAMALGRPVPTYTNLANYTLLNLADQDVLLVYEQEGTTAAMMATIGTAWTARLDNFLRDGGTIVVLDYSGGTYEVFDSSGVMTIPTARTFTTGGTVTVTSPADFVATGVVSGYTAPNGSAAYAGSSGGRVVLSESGEPLCRHLVR